MTDKQALQRAKVHADAMNHQRERRDWYIRRAAELGASLRAIASVTGLHHTGIRKIVQREEP